MAFQYAPPMLALGSHAAPGAARRPGASLIELMVALALFGVIGMATLRSLDRQARFHSGILSIIEQRAQHAAAHEAVATELRSVSSAAGDINRFTDSAIVFRLPVGSAVLCRASVGILDLTPDSVSAGQRLASIRTTPQPGDTAWLLDEGATDIASDDGWIGLHVTAVSLGPDRCIGTPYVDPILDTGRSSWRLSVSSDPPPTVAAGAPIRLTRMARFALYRSGTGEHALGYSDVNPATGTWVAIQPMSGPYDPYNSALPSASGFALAGVDSSGSGTMLLAPGSPAAISIDTRTRTTRAVRMDGVARGRYADSLRSLIALRNSR
jgi:hypothetical protein